jgi:hypothetical protein
MMRGCSCWGAVSHNLAASLQPCAARHSCLKLAQEQLVKLQQKRIADLQRHLQEQSRLLLPEVGRVARV